MIREQLDAGIIVESKSPWASPTRVCKEKGWYYSGMR